MRNLYFTSQSKKGESATLFVQGLMTSMTYERSNKVRNTDGFAAGSLKR